MYLGDRGQKLIVGRLGGATRLFFGLDKGTLLE